MSIPAGSFRSWHNGYWARLQCAPTSGYKGCRRGAAWFYDLGNGRWWFKVISPDVVLSPLSNPVEVRLTVGDDQGRTLEGVGGKLKAWRKHHRWGR